MADFVLVRKSRNIVSTMVHTLLNLLLGVGAVMITVLSGSPVIGIILILASKWRIFAVRARYLLLNLKSNLVDLIIGISIVLLSYYAGTSFLVVHILLMIFYSVWLIFIKPLSSESATLAQSLIAVFFGISASVIMSSNLDSIVGTSLAFLVGYAASRHVLAQSILTIFAFVYNYARQAMIKYQDDFRFKHILAPVIFGTVLICIIVLWFSNPIFNI